MTEEVRDELVKVANHLAEIQIEGVTDLTGFSNADKTVGAHLAAVVDADPSDIEAASALASLCGVKYQRQVGALVGEKMLAEFKKLARGSKITPEQREAAKMTVVAQPDVHEKYGARLLLAFMFNQEFSYALRDLGCKPFHGPDGWKWVVPIGKVEEAISTLKGCGARVVGYDAQSIRTAAKEKDRAVHCQVVGRRFVLKFDFDAAIIAAVKTLPERRYDAESRSWSIPLFRGAELLQVLQSVGGADVSEVEAAVSSVHLSASTRATPERAVVVDYDRANKHGARYGKKVRDFQRTGIEFLVQPLAVVHSSLNDRAARGIILGDDMGLGKTMESILAADAVVGDRGRILVVCPSTLGLNWRKEIMLWTGAEQVDIHIIENQQCAQCKHGEAFHAPGRCVRMLDGTNKPVDKTTRTVVDEDGKSHVELIRYHFCDCREPIANGFDNSKRWNIISYDVLDAHYDLLEQIGFDVLIVDEAHYAKNRESARSRFVVGGKVTMLREPDMRDGRYKEPRVIEGLAAQARNRVYLLTGTPITSRARDAFNLLRGVGHPLGRSFKTFAMRYCNPEAVIGRNGRLYGTTFNGSSNVEELMERIAPLFLQRKKEDYLDELPGMQRDWRPVQVDLERYRAIMAEYAARREAGELKSTGDHLTIMNEARVCVAGSKVKSTIETAESKIDQGAKVIIFSVYARVVDELAEHFGDRAVVIDGSMSKAQKEKAVARFQEDPAVEVLVGNYMNGQGAAVGLNITAASEVIFNDLDWVPANMSQAWCRAFRMGQKRFVNVIIMLAAGTFDEDMAVLLEEKFRVVNAFEGTRGTLFEDLVMRLATAPKNEEARALFDERTRGAAQAA